MKLKEGDIFKMKISTASCAIGQIINLSKNGLTVIVFEGLYDADTELDSAETTKNEILLFANTFDAKFHHKHWTVIENYAANLSSIKLPIYKLGTEEAPHYEDFFMRPIADKALLTANERSKIGYRNYVAPVRVENTVKAFYKLADWMEDYDKLLYQNLVKHSL